MSLTFDAVSQILEIYEFYLLFELESTISLEEFINNFKNSPFVYYRKYIYFYLESINQISNSSPLKVTVRFDEEYNNKLIYNTTNQILNFFDKRILKNGSFVDSQITFLIKSIFNNSQLNTENSILKLNSFKETVSKFNKITDNCFDEQSLEFKIEVLYILMQILYDLSTFKEKIGEKFNKYSIFEKERSQLEVELISINNRLSKLEEEENKDYKGKDNVIKALKSSSEQIALKIHKINLNMNFKKYLGKDYQNNSFFAMNYSFKKILIKDLKNKTWKYISYDDLNSFLIKLHDVYDKKGV